MDIWTCHGTISIPNTSEHANKCDPDLIILWCPAPPDASVERSCCTVPLVHVHAVILIITVADLHVRFQSSNTIHKSFSNRKLAMIRNFYP